MATISNYNKHLKLSERIKIEKYLDEGKSFRFISKEINKGVNTISREVLNRRYKEKGNYFNGFPGNCLKLEKAPFVCNSCPNSRKCRFNKFYYDAERAHENYKKILIESRVGIDQTTVEFKQLNKTVKEEIDKGHSFALIIHNHPELDVCERTIIIKNKAILLLKILICLEKLDIKNVRKNLKKNKIFFCMKYEKKTHRCIRNTL